MGPREIIAVLGISLALLTTILGVWLALDRRVTRLEAMNHRMTVVETAVLQLAGKAGASAEALSGIEATVAGLSARVGALEASVESGIGEVLSLLRTRVPGDRRRGES